MRAIALLCLLHAAFGEYSWYSPDETPPEDGNLDHVCVTGPGACGCCLMERQMQRMEKFFNITYEELKKTLTEAKTTLSNIRDSRSIAFSAALNGDEMSNCTGPFSNDIVIMYKHIFLNLGDGYDYQTGTFTANRSGVYSFSVTIYRGNPSGVTCANLKVNNQVVAVLREHHNPDFEDSATAVVAVKLKAADTVAVILPEGCIVCHTSTPKNVFTGFLLYSCD